MISHNIPVNAFIEAEEVLLLPLSTGRFTTVISSLFIFTSIAGFKEGETVVAVGAGVGKDVPSAVEGFPEPGVGKDVVA